MIVATVQSNSHSPWNRFNENFIPVSASSIDKETEFLLPFMAIATNGTYVFLTDDSGIGDMHLKAEPTIGKHKIELLNELLIRVIEERMGLAELLRVLQEYFKDRVVYTNRIE